MSNEKPVEVSDGSQPYKITLMVIGLVIFAIFTLGAFTKLDEVKDAVKEPNLGISTTEVSFNSVTNSSTTCAIGQGTLIVTTSTGRTSFGTTLEGATSTYLCRNSTCTAGGGRLLAVNGTFPFEQTDSYIGPYSCSSAGSSTVNYWHSQ